MSVVLKFLFAIAFASTLPAEEYGQIIFQDNFERNESQETTDEPGNGWGTNSKTRAKGHKQVDLKDGAMRIFIHAEADHAVSVTQPAEFTDGAVGLRFMLEDERDSLGLNFADLQCKSVHAGHMFNARVSPKDVLLQDLKTGVMNLEIRKAREAKTLTPEQQKMLKDKQKTIPHTVKTGQWHDMLVRIEGDELAVTIDGTPVGSFRSEGIAHPTKRLLRLSVPRNAVVDDLKIWRKK